VTKYHAPPGAILASLDVVNLVTTTPTEKALEVLRHNLEKDSTLKERTHHSIDTILKLVTVCVNNTYFQFGKKFYSQNLGMAMGSPLSPVLCNLYLEDLEKNAIATFNTKPLLFLRYVDDIFVIWLRMNARWKISMRTINHIQQQQNLQLKKKTTVLFLFWTLQFAIEIVELQLKYTTNQLTQDYIYNMIPIIQKLYKMV
jgi:hypothetical protein